jgi:hypothetical protein
VPRFGSKQLSFDAAIALALSFSNAFSVYHFGQFGTLPILLLLALFV